MHAAATFDRPVFARVRRLCLALPEATETVSWNHPSFRVGRKAFCTFEIVKGRPSIALRATGTAAAAMLRRDDFFATPYGRGAWVSAWADRAIDWTLIGRLVEGAYRASAGKRLAARVGTNPR